MEKSNVENLQEMMNKFYSEWQADGNEDLSQDEIAEKYFKDKPVVAYAVALGNFNYQVGNGGISQWLFNGYAEFGLDRIIEILSKAINYNPEKYQQLDFVVNQLKSLKDFADPHEGQWETDCEECDGLGYYDSIYCEDEDDDCGDEVCGQCWGAGTVNTDNYYEVVQHKIEDNFDSRFYAIKPDTVELFADIIADFDEIIKQSDRIKKEDKQETVGENVKPRVKLVGTDGNIFSIMGRVLEAMRKARVPQEIREAYKNEVTSSGSYDEALRVTMKYADVY